MNPSLANPSPSRLRAKFFNEAHQASVIWQSDFLLLWLHPATCSSLSVHARWCLFSCCCLGALCCCTPPAPHQAAFIPCFETPLRRYLRIPCTSPHSALSLFLGLSLITWNSNSGVLTCELLRAELCLYLHSLSSSQSLVHSIWKYLISEWKKLL